MHVIKQVPFHSVHKDIWHTCEQIQPIAQWPSLTPSILSLITISIKG